MGASISQTQFDTDITSITDIVLKKVAQLKNSSEKKKVAFSLITDADNTVSYLGQFLTNELTSELINRTGNDNNDGLNSSSVFVADFVIKGILSEFDDKFRINFKIVSGGTQELGSIKVALSSNPTLVSYHRKIVSETQPQKNDRPIATQPVEPPCNSNTGDFCFENTSAFTKDIMIRGPSEGWSRSILYTTTVKPGEKSCFYDIPAVRHDITIVTHVEVNDPAAGKYMVTENEDRQIKVEKCAKEKTLTPMKLK